MAFKKDIYGDLDGSFPQYAIHYFNENTIVTSNL